ncbi:MAG: hypothetical protein K8R23_06870 [Chthoniobacter sp.]|nr:hypothetical protein [Chthoniobacter sp.]
MKIILQRSFVSLVLTLSAFAQVPDALNYSIPAPPVGVQGGQGFGGPFDPQAAGPQLGYSVAVDGAYTVVGAPLDDVGGSDSGVVKVFDSTTGALLFVLPNPSPGFGDRFGWSVGISGTLVVVGAWLDDTGGNDAGSAYVFDLVSATPAVPVATLNNPIPATSQYFGVSVGISGTRVVVGAYGSDTGAADAGSAYVYDLAGATPTLPMATLNNPAPVGGDQFGWSVAISDTRVVIGAPQDDTVAADAGSAYVYDLASATPTVPMATLNKPAPAAGDQFGTSVAISGTRVAVGAARDDTGGADSGSAYVYDLVGATPTVPMAVLNNPSPAASDFFGVSVGIAGSTVVVGGYLDDTGASNAGSAYVYDLASSTPTVPVATLSNPGPAASDFFGCSVAVSGTRVIVGAYGDDTVAKNAGSAYLYDVGSVTPTVPVATLNSPSPSAGDSFGSSVGVSGTLMVVGAPYEDTGATNAGSAYVYNFASATPTVPLAILNNPRPTLADFFGWSVAISGTRVVVGAYLDDQGGVRAGSAYVYDLASATPTVPVATLDNPSPHNEDNFGRSVAISGTRVVVGANGDDTGATNAGTVYIYDLASTTPTVPILTLHNPGPTVEYDYFGCSVAISGTRVVVGANDDDVAQRDTERAYVFDLASATPTVPVAILDNPSPAPGNLYGDEFGGSVAIDGLRVVVGAINDETGGAAAGTAYVYDLGTTTPTVPVATLVNPNPSRLGDYGDKFGRSVAISGTRVVVGAPEDDPVSTGNAGSAYVYDLGSATPTVPVAMLNKTYPAHDDYFGTSVAIDGTTVAVGTPLDSTAVYNKGAAYVFGPALTPPAGGTMTLTPSSPVDASILLTVAFVGWTDTNLPLTYTILVDDLVVSPTGPTASRNFTAPATSGAHALKGRIQDALGNLTEVTQIFTVYSPIERWRQTYFGSPANTGNGANTIDFEHDSLINLIEFAFGTNPTTSTTGPLRYNGTFAGSGTITATGQPITKFEDGASGLEFRALFVRRTNYAAAGLTYTPQFSGDLSTWEASGTQPTVLADDGTYQIVSVPYPAFVGGKMARFFKLSVSISP